MNVRAKFKVRSNEYVPGNGATVVLDAVGKEGSPENADFFQWTPSGQVTMAVLNETAAKAFVAGSEMYVDFTPVDAHSGRCTRAPSALSASNRAPPTNTSS